MLGFPDKTQNSRLLVLAQELWSVVLRSVVSCNDEVDALTEMKVDVLPDNVRLVPYQKRHHQNHCPTLVNEVLKRVPWTIDWLQPRRVSILTVPQARTVGALTETYVPDMISTCSVPVALTLSEPALDVRHAGAVSG